MAPIPDLGLDALRSSYASGALTPSALIKQLYPLLQAETAIFIHLEPLDVLLAAAAALEAQPVDSRGELRSCWERVHGDARAP